jgi:hypothetical protein
VFHSRGSITSATGPLKRMDSPSSPVAKLPSHFDVAQYDGLIVAVLLTPQFPLFFVGKLPQHTSRRIAGKLSFKEEEKESATRQS